MTAAKKRQEETKCDEKVEEVISQPLMMKVSAQKSEEEMGTAADD